MSKIELDSVQAGFNLSRINNNFDKIETALNQDVLWRDNPSGEPNAMLNTLDMDGNPIINVSTINAGALILGGQTVEPGSALSANTIQIFEFTATAGQTTFSVAPLTPTTPAILFEVNGVAFPTSSISTTGSTLLFPALELNDEVVVRVFTRDVGGSPIVTDADVAENAAIDSSKLEFTPESVGAVSTTVESKLREIISVKDFGAVGDGVVNDTAALQAALDSNRPVLLPAGKYRTTATLVIDPIRNRNTGFYALSSLNTRYPSTQQSGGPVWDGTDEPTIFYDGAPSATAAVISASPEAVGVEPSSTFADSVYGILLDGITLDANNKAGFGLYCARVQDLQLNRLKARGATVAGISINGTYSGSARSVHCYLNPGRGFELGGEDTRSGWTTNDKVNAFYIYDLHCDANGSGAAFRDTDPLLVQLNCGFFFSPHRGVVADGVVSENNFGANIVFAPSGAGNVIRGVYTELGCKYAPGGAGTDAISLGYAINQWGIIYVGIAAAYHNRIQDGAIAQDWIWMTGTSPTPAREEGAVELYNIVLAGGVKADWAAYRMVNCAIELESITGTAPAGAFTLRGGLQFGANTDILNTYDEGTFTPAFAGITVPGTGWATSIAAGSYTRIGRIVFFTGRITLSAVSGDATGQIAITGLPFTVANSNSFQGAVTLAQITNLTTAVVSLDGALTINNTRFTLQKRTAAATSGASLALADLSATTSITFSGHYVAA
jgi:hypothetical protein